MKTVAIMLTNLALSATLYAILAGGEHTGYSEIRSDLDAFEERLDARLQYFETKLPVRHFSENYRRRTGQSFVGTPRVLGEYTARPELKNGSEVRRLMAREQEVDERIRGGTVWIDLFVDEEGRVQQALKVRGSGNVHLDNAGMRVATAHRFTPARNLDQIVPVWISAPIVFPY